MEINTSEMDTSFSFSIERRRRPTTEQRINQAWDFVRNAAASIPTKVGAEKTETTVVAFKNLKAGRCKPSFDTLVAWCLNDKAFAAQFAMHLGVILPGDVEKTEALMRMATAYGRGE